MRKVNITATAQRQCLDDSKLTLTGVYMHKFSNIELIALRPSNMYAKTGVKTTVATSHRCPALASRCSVKNQGPGLRSTQLLRCLVPSCHKDLVFYCLAARMCGPKLATQTAEAVPNNFLMAPLMRWQQFKILGTNCDTVLGCVWLKVWYEWVGTVTVSESHLTNDL